MVSKLRSIAELRAFDGKKRIMRCVKKYAYSLELLGLHFNRPLFVNGRDA